VEFLKVLDEVEKEEQNELEKANKMMKHDGKQKKPRKKV
jgi:predicted DNA-binding transcriptional regulator